MCLWQCDVGDYMEKRGFHEILKKALVEFPWEPSDDELDQIYKITT